MFSAIFQASYLYICCHIARYTNYEQVAETLIKDEFWRDSRIRATQNFGMPHCEPSPNSCSKRGVSCGVLMIRTSRMPAIISVLRG